MKWVTWEQVGVNRMACAWLITKYIDPEADTVQEVMLEPAAAGLDVICQGMRLVSPDDPVALERGKLVYEALYAQFASEPTQE